MASPPKQGQRFIYQFCESVQEKPNGEIQFETKSWCPVDLAIQDIQSGLSDKFLDEIPWTQYYNHGLEVLCEGHEVEENSDGLGFVDQGWLRPDSETDKLYMSMGGGDVIEVGHPTPCDGKIHPRYDQY